VRGFTAETASPLVLLTLASERVACAGLDERTTHPSPFRRPGHGGAPDVKAGEQLPSAPGEHLPLATGKAATLLSMLEEFHWQETSGATIFSSEPGRFSETVAQLALASHWLDLLPVRSLAAHPLHCPAHPLPCAI
jgi:hypothetical protein